MEKEGIMQASAKRIDPKVTMEEGQGRLGVKAGGLPGILGV